MKNFLFAALFLFSVSVMAADTHVYETDQAKVVLTDEACSPAIAEEFILSEYQSMFSAYRLIPKTPEMKKQLKDKEVVKGCWSDNPDITPPGNITFVNELGAMGYQDVRVFTKIVDVGV